MWDKLFAPSDLLQKGMEASWLRNAVIRDNLANYETPGFKSSNVEFETILASALETGGFTSKQTREKHISIGNGDLSSLAPRVTQNRELSMRMDGNNVDVEAENVKLAQNSLYYNTMLEKLNSELRRIKLAVSEGK